MTPMNLTLLDYLRFLIRKGSDQSLLLEIIIVRLGVFIAYCMISWLRRIQIFLKLRTGTLRCRLSTLSLGVSLYEFGIKTVGLLFRTLRLAR